MTRDPRRGRILLTLLGFRLFVELIVAVSSPYFILTAGSEPARRHFDALAFPGLLVIGLGALAYLRSAWDFAVVGLADAPRAIVASGAYKIVRNPMYGSLVLVLLGESLLFKSWRLLGYAGAFWVLVHLFVILYEERALRRQFGTGYRRYCETVPRWIPHLRGASA
jgi:protein-S-isoprenylcysteine O-methyltransferase Ste14